MVGHTGVEEAAIKAVETVDTCVGKAVDAIKEVNGQLFICADHGNAEQLVDYETGTIYCSYNQSGTVRQTSSRLTDSAYGHGAAKLR